MERLSRRRLLGRIGVAGGLGLAALAATGCGPPLPSPGGLIQEFAGQARQATGAAPPPKQLHWITPIAPPAETIAAATADLDRNRALGWQRMLDPWKSAHPDITLLHEVVASDKLPDRQLALVRSGGPADVAYTDWGGALGEAGIVDPLDVGPLARQIVPVALAPQSAGNQVYALPIFLTCLGLYLNQDRFQQADLNPATPLRDWSSFENAVQKLTDRSQQRYGFDVFGSGSPLAGQMRYAPFLWSAGGSFFDDDGVAATWNQAPGMEAVNYLARLSQNYAAPGSAVATTDQLVQSWLSGKTATLVAGPELVGEIDSRSLTYGVQSVPAYIQGQASSLAMSAGASALFAISRHKDWGLDFIRYLASKDAQVAGLSSLPLLPANAQAGDDAPVFRTNATLSEFLRILREDDVHSFPLARGHNTEIQQIFRAYLGVALQGLSTPESAWNKSAAAATALLKALPTPTSRASG